MPVDQIWGRGLWSSSVRVRPCECPALPCPIRHGQPTCVCVSCQHRDAWRRAQGMVQWWTIMYEHHKIPDLLWTLSRKVNHITYTNMQNHNASQLHLTFGFPNVEVMCGRYSTVGVQLLCQIRAYTAPFELYRRTGRKDAYSSVVVSGCDVAGFKLRRSLLDRAQGENLGSFYPKLKFLYFNDHFKILNFFISSRKENQNYGNRIPSLSTSSTSRESREKRR